MSDFCRGTPVDHVRMKTPLVERGQRIRRRRRILLYKFCVIALEWSVPHSFTELAQSCISCIYLIIPEICRKAVAVQYGPPFRNLIEGVPTHSRLPDTPHRCSIASKHPDCRPHIDGDLSHLEFNISRSSLVRLSLCQHESFLCRNLKKSDIRPLLAVFTLTSMTTRVKFFFVAICGNWESLSVFGCMIVLVVFWSF